MAEMAAIHAACFTTPRPWSQPEIASLLTSAGTFSVTRPQGFAIGRVVLDECELLTLAVAPDARRTGQGRALLQAFASDARARGAVRLLLEVAADNDGARALYAIDGWRESGRRKGYYHHPDGSRIDAILYDKCLT